MSVSAWRSPGRCRMTRSSFWRMSRRAPSIPRSALRGDGADDPARARARATAGGDHRDARSGVRRERRSVDRDRRRQTGRLSRQRRAGFVADPNGRLFPLPDRDSRPVPAAHAVDQLVEGIDTRLVRLAVHRQRNRTVTILHRIFGEIKRLLVLLSAIR
jgi:hypothetical protein